MMAESMKGLKRTHRCAEISLANVGETVTVMGWVQKNRNKGGLDFALAFSLCENKITRFSFGDRPVRDMMGKNEPGEYDCAVSAAWVDEKTISVMAQVIDTYFGCLNIHIGFKDNRATVLLKKSGQYVFDGMEGSFIAFADKE